MKKYACILAAGKGSRLKDITLNQSKWMVEVNKISLMERYLKAFKENNIYDIFIITGHASKILEDRIFELNKIFELNIKFIHNEKYDVTNNIFSLNIALNEIQKIADLGRLILAECDIFFTKDTLNDFLSLDNGNHILASPYEYWMDGSCISTDKTGSIKSLLNKNEVVKNIKNPLFKTVNWYSFERDFVINQLSPFVNTYSKSISAVSYYELVIKILLQISQIKLSISKIHASKWVEIDDSYDLQLAECFDCADTGNLESFVNRYGGFWKFPWLRDLTLLVNPYFPTQEMIKEINGLNEAVLRHYPSSQKILANLASKSFPFNQNQIMVANGVCEIINNVLTRLEGEFEIITPYFLEYERVLGNRLIKSNDLGDFTFSNHIIVVNPNNPDGKVITLEKIKFLLDKLKNSGKYLIYDESFADFYSDQEISLINNPDLSKYENLIILKSLGKTYGIPGIRLGLLFNKKDENILNWRSYLPIWNINSISEVFLDLLPRYQEEYKKSIEKISDNAKNFYSYLVHNQSNLYEVYRPTANFILISFNSLKTLKKVEIGLFKNYFLTKSLICREGLPKFCMRLAVLDDETNKELSNLLKQLLIA